MINKRLKKLLKSFNEGKEDGLLEKYSSDTIPSDIFPDINENLYVDSEIITSSQTESFQSESKSSLSSIKETDDVMELKFEENRPTMPDEKVKDLINKLTEIKCLNTLKRIFEDFENEFSGKVLIDSLVALADPSPFNLYYSKESVARLELHLRTWVAVLERICFSQICLTKKLRDDIYNSLIKFAEIHQNAIEGLENNSFKHNFNQQGDDDEKITKNRNYNIDFLLIHLRDTLNGLRDDETWIQKIIRRTKELLKTTLNITLRDTVSNNNCSTLSMLAQLRQGLSFKYPVASYYVDWRIMLIIQNSLFIWSESSEKIISKKFGGRILMEYFWCYLEREWINVTDKSMLDSQPKFDESLNKLVKSLRNTGGFINDLTGNEPLVLPHTLWFGILDLAHNLIQKSTQTSIHGLCYYLAIESLNKAPSSFIQFKAIEILIYIHNIDKQMFSMIEVDFNQYLQKLNENKSTDFQNLLTFVKEKYIEDIKILKNNIEIGKVNRKIKSLYLNSYSKKKQLSGSSILSIIADEMTCPISSEPEDQLCILKCQHILSLENFKKLEQKKCPNCRKKIFDSDIKYISQSTIYKNLYPHLLKAGYILSPIELENKEKMLEILNNNYNDSDDSEEDLMLTKKLKFMDAIKSNSNRSLQSIFQIRNSKKQHPIYQNITKELEEENYEKSGFSCKELLKFYPKSYSIRCILAYTYRCLNDYEQAHLYLEEAINLKKKDPIAYFIRGEIYFRQNEYEKAINNLEISMNYKAKIKNLYILLGNCYEKQKDYSNTLKILDKLLNINKEDSLILCYYGEILSNMKRYNEAILYFTKANIINPENVHNLNKRAIAYFICQEYDKALLDLEESIQLVPYNNIAYYYKWLIYYVMENNNNATVAFEKCTELDVWSHLCKVCKFDNFKLYDSLFCWFDSFSEELGIISKFSIFMYKVQNIYFVSNLINKHSELYQFQENNSNSLSGQILSFKDRSSFHLKLPNISSIFKDDNSFSSYYIIWKINIKKLISKNCFVKFITFTADEVEHMEYLNYEDLLKLEGQGWIEYKLPCKIYEGSILQPMIRASGFINMQIDYVRCILYDETYEELTYLPKMNHLLSVHSLQ
ncbi:hypothetical protein C1645_740892 [Glomus cerebriforme]|uniref:Uncharacterized protein n=1 Tax=Glomus cerebriforme TaxID=658196 RepID=A0A397SQS3_9GLOM|nr:hypothetical protein C1645_740892 [Glomus cerebriforme]